MAQRFRDCKWSVFGTLHQHIPFTSESRGLIARCEPLLSTHVLFEYLSDTHGTLHVVAVAGGVRIPYEYTFQHTLDYPHYNVRFSQLPVRMSMADRVVAHSHYPIGRTCGTFYRTSSPRTVLVSPTLPTVAHVLTPSELQQIDALHCSFVDVVAGLDPVDLLCEVMQRIPNPDGRPSIVLTNKDDVERWRLHTLPGTRIHSYHHAIEDVPVHVLVVDEAHLCDREALPSCRHLLCLTPCCSTYLARLLTFSGIDQLPFPPLEPARDLCVHVDQCPVTRPRIELVDPCTDFRRATAPTVPRFRTYVSPNRVYTQATDPCAICLAVPMIDAALLPCGHVFCLVCLQRMIQTGLRRCPCCRASITQSVQRPPWTVTETTSTTTTAPEMGSHRLNTKLQLVTHYIHTALAPICIMTNYADVAELYIHTATLLGRTVSRRCEDEPDVVICSARTYTRHVHVRCGTVVMNDLPKRPCDLYRVLASKDHLFILLLERGCVDEQVYKQWMVLNTNRPLLHSTT